MCEKGIIRGSQILNITFMLNKTLRFAHSRLVNSITTPAKFIALACYGMVACQLHSQPAAFPNSQFWLTDGPVNAILATYGMVYIGCDFSYVGPHTGQLV